MPASPRSLSAAQFLPALLIGSLVLVGTAVAAPAPPSRAQPPALPTLLDAPALAQQVRDEWLRAHEPPAGALVDAGVRGTAAAEGVIPSPEDFLWRDGFGLPSPDAEVIALLSYQGRLIVGGYFTNVGEVAAPGLAVWDGGAWSTLGDFPGRAVTELAPYGDGFLALSGTVWHWDGTGWSELAPLPPGHYPSAMAVHDGQVALSVQFLSGSTWRWQVLITSGKGWVPLSGEFDSWVNALAWYHGELYVAGSFQSVNGVSLEGIARWDGSAWRSVAGEPPNEPYGLSSLAVFGDELVASGSFWSGVDPPQDLSIGSWNGSYWTILRSSSSQAWVARLKVMGPDLYALGQFYADYFHGIERWDGTAWHSDGDSLGSMVQDLASYKGDLYAGGDLFQDGSRPAPKLMWHRNGRWEAAFTPSAGTRGLLSQGGMIYAVASAPGGIVVAGDFAFAGVPGGWEACRANALWDGARWTQIGGASLVTEMAWHHGSLYAAGYFRSVSGYTAVGVLSGNQWQPVGPTSQPFMGSVSAVTSALGDLFAGGSIGNAFGGVARWDGTAWHDVGGGITRGNQVTALTGHGDELIAGGWFEEMGGVLCRNIAAWSPATGWRPMGAGLDGFVYDLLSAEGELYAAGYFWSGGTHYGLARWQHQHWELVPGPRFAGALGWFRGRLVVGAPDLSGGVAFLEPDGSWRPLGSGVNGYVRSITTSGTSLFLGGTFGRAGGKPAYGFAEWRGGSGSTPTAGFYVSVGPNPSAALVHLRYDLPVAAHARVEIYDLAGRLVETAFDGEQSAGSQDVVWHPDPGSVKAGVYLAQLTAGGAKQIVRVVRID